MCLAATTIPIPPSPRTRSTRYFPRRLSPGWTSADMSTMLPNDGPLGNGEGVPLRCRGRNCPTLRSGPPPGVPAPLREVMIPDDGDTAHHPQAEDPALRADALASSIDVARPRTRLAVGP